MSDIMSAVLRTEPDLTPIPWRARRLLARCLTKDRRLRLQAIGEARIMIDHPEEEVPARAKRSPIKFLIAAIICLAGIASWALLRKTPREPRMVSRWAETLPRTFVEEGGLAISRDGRRVAYVVADGESESIWLRELDQPEGNPIPGTEGGRRPFFSPDGNWIAYWTPNVLKKIPVTGGSAITLCPGAGFYGGSWGQDNRIVVPSNDGLVDVPAGGGTCKALTTADPQKGEAHRFPQILPGGEAILYTKGIQGEYDRAQIAIFDLKSGSHRVLENVGSCARYVATGHLVYVRSGTMFAAPFDLRRLAVTGPEVAVIEGVYFRATGGFASYAVSDSGLLLYSAGRPGRTLSALEWRDRKGVAQPLPLPVQAYTGIRLSPDGQRAVAGMQRTDANQDLWNIGLERGDLIKLTSGALNLAPEWTPNGQRVVFRSTLNHGINWTSADGSSKPDLLLEETEHGLAFPVSWAPDGGTLLFQEGVPSRIWVVDIPVSGNKPHPLFEATSANLRDAKVSPDGKWVAYTSDESGTNQVYVCAFPTPAGKTPVSADGGQEPRWSRDTRELFYRNPLKNQLMVTEVQTDSTFRAGPPKPLFELSTNNWDVDPDAKRFLVAKPQEATVDAPQLRVVVNWLDELPRKVPAGKQSIKE